MLFSLKLLFPGAATAASHTYYSWWCSFTKSSKLLPCNLQGLIPFLFILNIQCWYLYTTCPSIAKHDTMPYAMRWQFCSGQFIQFCPKVKTPAFWWLVWWGKPPILSLIEQQSVALMFLNDNLGDLKKWFVCVDILSSSTWTSFYQMSIWLSLVRAPLLELYQSRYAYS